MFDLPGNSQGLSIEERVNRLPSVVLPAERNVFQGEFKNVLILCADHLGDVAASLPAMFALRELFSNADMMCLAAPSNCELLSSTSLFSDIVPVELVHDPGRDGGTLRSLNS